jgi:hypothetical protein
MKFQLRRWAACAALVLAPTAGLATSPAEPVPAPPAAPTEADTPFADGKVADDDALNGATAREDLSLVARSEQANTVSRNSVSGVTTTGEISIADNAFQNASGLTVINANTGNNVAMNASLNVNIVMTGPQ